MFRENAQSDFFASKPCLNDHDMFRVVIRAAIDPISMVPVAEQSRINFQSLGMCVIPESASGYPTNQGMRKSRKKKAVGLKSIVVV
jgi:hypothetical protein